jgi:hypothetical protein
MKETGIVIKITESLTYNKRSEHSATFPPVVRGWQIAWDSTCLIPRIVSHHIVCNRSCGRLDRICGACELHILKSGGVVGGVSLPGDVKSRDIARAT